MRIIIYDDYEGTEFVIDLNFKSMKSLEPMSPSHDELLDNTHSSSFVDVIEETPPLVARESPIEHVLRLNIVDGKIISKHKIKSRVSDMQEEPLIGTGVPIYQSARGGSNSFDIGKVYGHL